MLGEKNPTLDKFRAALAENGAEFPVSNTVSLKKVLKVQGFCQGLELGQFCEQEKSFKHWFLFCKGCLSF